MTLSLSTRLSLWFGSAILVIVFAMTFITQEVTVWNMERAVDDALRKHVHMVAAIIASDITPDEQSYVLVMKDLTSQELPFVPLLLRITSPQGRVIMELGKVSDSIVESLDYQLGAPGVGRGRFESLAISGTTPLRVYTVSVSDPRTDQPLALVQAVESLAQVEEAKRELWVNGILVGLSGSLIAILAGIALLHRGFRPLRRILQSIDAVDYDHLSVRLKDGTGPAEMQQLAKSLTAMWQRLDSAAADRQKSLGNVSHDLRTPLTALQGQLEVLLLQPSLNQQTRDSLERMLRETGRLVRMVKNLLLNVQLESIRAVPMDSVDLRDLVDEIVGDLWVLTTDLEFKVTAPVDVEVLGDRDLLKQMLLNLLDNSIKFTPKKGSVELKLSCENNSAVLVVADSGRGISSDDLSHVTEAFYRSKGSRKSASEGVGLGLSIAKKVAELHGGRLEIRSRERVGTTVAVYLPLKPATDKPMSSPA
jgi:two-component system OmpR family sensor kinase